MRRASVQVGEAELCVTLEVMATDGNGLACFLHGGTLSHVGGQALAAPSPILHGERLSRCDLWVATVPGHKDSEVAAEVARRLCIAREEPVSVTAGIHVDAATSAQIEVLRENCLKAVDAILDALQEGASR